MITHTLCVSWAKEFYGFIPMPKFWSLSNQMTLIDTSNWVLTTPWLPSMITHILGYPLFSLQNVFLKWKWSVFYDFVDIEDNTEWVVKLKTRTRSEPSSLMLSSLGACLEYFSYSNQSTWAYAILRPGRLLWSIPQQN